MSWQEELSKIVTGKIRLREKLSGHTTWRIGGETDALVEPTDLVDLAKIIKFARKSKLPVFILGAGSNCLISDKGVKGIVIKLTQPFFNHIELKGNLACVGSGVALSRLINLTQDKGLSGCEFLAGIPGTLGGALAMNAGVRDICLADLVREVRVLDFTAREKFLKEKDIKFAYRNSGLSKFIIISAKLKLSPKGKKAIFSNIKRFAAYKKNIQDLKSKSAGCVFKNPSQNFQNNNLTAGKMIDACGMKGARVGGAVVSDIHANFILNRGDASAADILKLMRLVKERVRQRFKVSLQPEIKLIGKF